VKIAQHFISETGSKLAAAKPRWFRGSRRNGLYVVKRETKPKVFIGEAEG
jgi:hypothetical protein